MTAKNYGAADAFDFAESEFQVRDYIVAVHDALIYDVLLRLDERAREIVLMAHWLEMSDQEISDETGSLNIFGEHKLKQSKPVQHEPSTTSRLHKYKEFSCGLIDFFTN